MVGTGTLIIRVSLTVVKQTLGLLLRLFKDADGL